MGTTIIRTIQKPFEVGKYVSVDDLLAHYNAELANVQKMLITQIKDKKDTTYYDGVLFGIELVITNLTQLKNE